jgi:hypothetical protein
MSAGGAAGESSGRPFKPLPEARKKLLEAEAKAAAEASSRKEGKGKDEKVIPGKAAVVPHMPKGPDIDGEMDELYSRAARLTMERNEGPEDMAVTHATEIYLLTDPRFLYIAFRIHEPSLDPATYMKEEVGKIDFAKRFENMSRVRERDQAMWDDGTWEDAYVEMLLEPGARRRPDDYYHIAVNTLGTLYDARDRDEINWDPAIQVKTKLGRDGWYVIEMAIPLDDLVPREQKFPKLWCANFLRMVHHVGEMAWSRSWKTHLPENFGTLVFELGAMEEE